MADTAKESSTATRGGAGLSLSSAPVKPPPRALPTPAADKTPSALHRARHGIRIDFSLATKLLWLAAVLLLGLTAWEAVTSVSAFQEGDTPGPEAAPSGGGSGIEAPPASTPMSDEDLAALIQRYRARPPFGPLGESPMQGTNQYSAGGTFGEYLRENMDLKALAPGKAVLVDRKTERMYVLRTGDRISVKGFEDEQFSLKEIGSSEVVLESPMEKVVVK